MPMIDPVALKPLSAAILSDAMDSLVLVGRARTGLYLPAYEVKGDEKDTRNALLRGVSLASVFQRKGVL